MAETVTGKLLNFSGIPIGAMNPRLIFQARQPTVSEASFLVTDPIIVIPHPTTSLWSVPLIGSFTTPDITVYDVSAEWRDPNYFGEGNGYIRRDVLHGLHVPDGGGDIGGMVGTVPTNQRFVYVSLSAPPASETRPFTLWLHMDPDNPDSSRSTGNLFEWRNA